MAPKAKARPLGIRARGVAPRVQHNRLPNMLIRIRDADGWEQVEPYWRSRYIDQIAAYIFQECGFEHTEFWVTRMWYVMPHRIFNRIKQRYDEFWRELQRATRHGVGHRPGEAWAVAPRGCVMGFA